MFNQVTLIGRLGADPKVKHFSETSAVAEFTLATSERYKARDGQWVESTQWHNIKLPLKSMAERAEKFLRKGSLISLTGSIEYRKFEDKDSNTRYVTEIIVKEFLMLDKKQDEPAARTENQSNYQASNNTNTGGNGGGKVELDDLPF